MLLIDLLKKLNHNKIIKTKKWHKIVDMDIFAKMEVQEVIFNTHQKMIIKIPINFMKMLLLLYVHFVKKIFQNVKI